MNKENKIRPKAIAQYFRGGLTLLFLAALGYYGFTVDHTKLFVIIKKAHWEFIFPSVAIIIVVLYLKALRLKILTPDSNSVVHYFRIQCIAILLATFSPGRLGELVKIWFLKKDGLTGGSALYIFFLERITDVFILLFFGLLYYFFLLTDKILLGAAAVLIFFLSLILLTLSMKGIVNLPMPGVVQQLFLKFRIEQDIHKNFLGSILLSVIIWLLEGLFFLFIIMIIGGEISYLASVGIIAISGIASLLSILPLGLGSVDLSIVYLLQKSGLSPEAVAAVLFLLRAVVVSTLSIAGICSSGFSLSTIRFFMSRAVEANVPDISDTHTVREKLAKT